MTRPAALLLFVLLGCGGGKGGADAAAGAGGGGGAGGQAGAAGSGGAGGSCVGQGRAGSTTNGPFCCVPLVCTASCVQPPGSPNDGGNGD
jgi:hypothetical protein